MWSHRQNPREPRLRKSISVYDQLYGLVDLNVFRDINYCYNNDDNNNYYNNDNSNDDNDYNNDYKNNQDQPRLTKTYQQQQQQQQPYQHRQYVCVNDSS